MESEITEKKAWSIWDVLGVICTIGITVYIGLYLFGWIGNGTSSVSHYSSRYDANRKAYTYSLSSYSYQYRGSYIMFVSYADFNSESDRDSAIAYWDSLNAETVKSIAP